MPLDLSEQETTNTELNEFKTRVKTVADKYTKVHGWCDVVNSALREIGVEPEGVKAMVEVEMKVQLPVDISDVKDLIGKTPEEQNEIIAQKIIADRFITVPSHQNHGITYLSTHDVIKQDQLKVIDVTKMDRPVTINGIPAGYVAMFMSSEGRVTHYLRSDWQQQRTFGRHSLCGEQISYPTQESDRDEGRVCAKCQQRARALT